MRHHRVARVERRRGRLRAGLTAETERSAWRAAEAYRLAAGAGLRARLATETAGFAPMLL